MTGYLFPLERNSGGGTPTNPTDPEAPSAHRDALVLAGTAAPENDAADVVVDVTTDGDDGLIQTADGQTVRMTGIMAQSASGGGAVEANFANFKVFTYRYSSKAVPPQGYEAFPNDFLSLNAQHNFGTTEVGVIAYGRMTSAGDKINKGNVFFSDLGALSANAVKLVPHVENLIGAGASYYLRNLNGGEQTVPADTDWEFTIICFTEAAA